MFKKILIPLMLSLSLGLAPFFPEPHLWGKIKWIWGGAYGMMPTDWFDAAMHAAPWIWLTVVSITLLRKRIRLKNQIHHHHIKN